MGNPTQALMEGIKSALNHDSSLYSFPSKMQYQEDDVRRFNLDVKTVPACVTYPKTTEQVVAIVKVAIENGVHVQAKSGGHSYANFSSPDGGIVVDLKRFRQYSMDQTTWRATVGAGILLGELTKLMYNSGRRAMAYGVCPHVGIGGHATIGGLGPSSRLWGSALDHVEEVEVVTADGRILRASDKQNSDLFWALKGAGAGFGIITTFVLRTEPAPESVVHYSFSFTLGSWSTLAGVFKEWQAFVSRKDLTWSFASTANITPAGLLINGTYFGTRDQYDSIMEQVTFPANASKSTVLLKDWLGAVATWWENIRLHMAGGIPAHSFSKSLCFNGVQLIPDSVVDLIFNKLETAEKGTPLWFVTFDLAGGQVNCVPRDATSYAHRDVLFSLQSYAICAEPLANVSDTTKAFLSGINEAIVAAMKEADEPSDFGAYPGCVDLSLDHPQRCYWRYNLPRLEEIKGRWDPRDVFSNPQSVRPFGKEGFGAQMAAEAAKDAQLAVKKRTSFWGRMRTSFKGTGR